MPPIHRHEHLPFHSAYIPDRSEFHPYHAIHDFIEHQSIGQPAGCPAVFDPKSPPTIVERAQAVEKWEFSKSTSLSNIR
jgi:hypothetical protein